jgi:hypothetical protein
MTRRSLLLSTLSAATLSDIANAQEHAQAAKASKAAFRYLSSADAREIEALAAQIIPSDGTPGAKEAGRAGLAHARQNGTRLGRLQTAGYDLEILWVEKFIYA